MTLFEHTTRPDDSLLYQRHDPNDVRFGEIVQTAEKDYQASEIVLLGYPYDEGVKRNQGRVGAAQAPEAIRRCFYKLATSTLGNLKLFDLGNTLPQETLEATHSVHQALVRQIIQDGKFLITLGGGNDISYPDCAGLAQVVNQVLAFNVDAHFDVRADAIPNSGTPYRQLIEGGHIQPENFYEMAYQPFANSMTYLQYLQEMGVRGHSLPQLRPQGVLRTFKKILKEHTADAIFWGIDLDSVRAADAPGVSAPNPVGLTGEELCDIAKLAGSDSRTRLVEFSEVNPTYDIDQRTCRLTAVAIFYVILGYKERNHG